MTDAGPVMKDHYATLGVARTATHDEIRRAYRTLARKYHPDVSQEPDAQTHFMAAAEAHEALVDPDRRAAYDEACRRSTRPAAPFRPAAEDDDFFDALFRHRTPFAGSDQHARIEVDLDTVYHGARRTIALQTPVVDSLGRASLQTRHLEVDIPKGVRPGQRLRLAGQGEAGQDGAPAGDLYLDITLRPHARFRVEGRDVHVDLPVSPWEAALGATVTTATPEGAVRLTIPPGSFQGRTLRLKGKGLPGSPPGDLHARLGIAWPAATDEAGRQAYEALAAAFAGYDPRG